ncbi:hypothetical protein PR003_g11094 [Phytophthora rubi]|uniref:Uncharacterized protein n=1 Tax=Phytophthora rubi TaxID=129364 RepID=A0A6A3NDX2_9STRA|nr:hypothetical protein PR001_g10633 [Phytophthora rubi]KAE9039796.1 hypothetical protein PR002_g5312 [Phytophthora rubi]KAE9339275.1 hypothetical protein PR003_g11094 [Phytophthora rubi]
MDHELTAVCQFLNDLSLDEIYRLDVAAFEDAMWSPTSPTSDESVCSDDDTDASTVTGVTSDEGSDVEDPPTSSRKRAASHLVASTSPTKKKRLPKSDQQRARQRVYDQKCRFKKQTSHKANCQSFVPATKLFVVLMEKLMEQTEMRIQLLRLVGEDARSPAHGQQLRWNRDALKVIDQWTLTWNAERSKNTGKFFLREQANEVEPEMAKLTDVGKRLALLTAELQWRVGGLTFTLAL